MYSVQREVMSMTKAVSAQLQLMIGAKHKQFPIPMHAVFTDSDRKALDALVWNKVLRCSNRMPLARKSDESNKQRAANVLDVQVFTAMMKA